MSYHTLLHRYLKPLVTHLAATSVQPDHVTMLRLVTGLAAAAGLARGGIMLDAGAAMLLLSCLLDRLDGALARRTRRFSKRGPYFDLLADCISTMAVFIGLGIGTRASVLPSMSPILGILGAIGVVTLFWRLNISRPDPVPGRRRPFDPDDAMLLLPVLIWCGCSGLVLLLVGIGTPLAAALVCATVRPAAAQPAAASLRDRMSASAASSRSDCVSVPTVIRR